MSCIERCPHFRNPLLWTPWGPSVVSCIERCPHFRGEFILSGTYQSVLNTKVSVFQGCPLREVHVVLYTVLLLQIGLICTATVPPHELFTAAPSRARQQQELRVLMDDLDINEVSNDLFGNTALLKLILSTVQGLSIHAAILYLQDAAIEVQITPLPQCFPFCYCTNRATQPPSAGIPPPPPMHACLLATVLTGLPNLASYPGLPSRLRKKL